MPQWKADSLTEQQRKWFASLREGLARETGKDLAAWVELARACPETRPRARLAWMKATYGLGQNRASIILDAAFPGVPPTDGTDPDPLWREPGAQAIFSAVEAIATGLEGVVTGGRKGYTAFSRRHQFAALRPVRGRVRLGLALAPEADAGLQPAAREGWSDRLLSAMDLVDAAAVDAVVAGRLRQAWERS